MWVLGLVLLLDAHFSASYLVPLDETAQKTFGGLLRWAWPWAYGDSGLLGKASEPSGFPLSGFFIAMTSGGLLLLAALAAIRLWIPFGWWRPLAVSGSAISLLLMVLFFGPTKLIPIAVDVFVLYAALSHRTAPF
jgi:hypothetical protein